MKNTRLFRWLLIAALLGTGVAFAADQPGQTFDVKPSDMPAPYATPAVNNSSEVVPRPPGAMPHAPSGFTVSVFASGLEGPRFLAVAPNGDVFVSQPDAGKVTVLREANGKVSAHTFASGFTQPHGLAFHGDALYVADRKAVWKLPYSDGALSAQGRTRVTTAPSLGRVPGGHFTRDIAFGPDGTLFVAVGSHENIGVDPLPEAAVSTVSPDGSLAPFVTGTRNPVGIAFYPGTDDVYVTVNERDGLGDSLPPDYFTHLQKGGFYGWPYAYIGPHSDPTLGAKRPDLVAKTITPDVLFQAHSAPLGLVFYEGSQFPAEYRGDAFVALHGSWNSSKPTGYKVVRVKFQNGHPVGGYDSFLTGFWDGSTSPARVWGRPVGLAVAKDGSLLVADDAGKVIWQVAYTGK